MKLFIGIDLGTSAAKLLLVDGRGTIRREVTKEYPLSFPQPGWSEQDPAEWWRACTEGLRELLDGEVHDDLPPVEEEEAALTEDITPAVPAAVTDTKPEAVPAEMPEKAEETKEANITGFWTLDGTTNYRFNEDGIGELVLPEHEFSFIYTVEEDELTLEFEDAGIDTAVFTFTLEDDTLILKRVEEAGIAEFTLEKTAD